MVNQDVWVVVPVYNEERVIADVVECVRETFPHVVCVDDGSADRSAQRVAAAGAHLVRHPFNMGQGAALQTGLSYALARPEADYFITFDADGQHQVSDAQRMVDEARSGSADVILGSRFLGQVHGVPWPRRLALRTAVTLSPAARKLRLTDVHNGLRVLTRKAAEHLHIRMDGMGHASEIVSYLADSQCRVREVPVTIAYTDYAKSKGQSLINGVNILFDLSLRQRR